MSEEQSLSMSRSITAWRDEEGCFSHEGLYDVLWKARYQEARAEDMRRRQAELEHSAAWTLASNKAARRLPLYLPYSPTSPVSDDCRYVAS